MKAYKIKDDIVAAHNEAEAIITWAEHFEVEIAASGPAEELDLATYTIGYEQDDGSFKEGPLSDLLYDGMAPEVIIDGENS